VPDFILEENEVNCSFSSIPANVPELRVSRASRHVRELQCKQASASRDEKDAITFVKQNSIQHGGSLMHQAAPEHDAAYMNAIIEYQKALFLRRG